MLKDLDYKIRSAQTPFYRALKKFLKFFLQPTPPRFPRVFKPILGLFYQLHWGLIILFRFLSVFLYKHPLLQGRVSLIGRNVHIDGLPYITGPVEVFIGDNVYFGADAVMSGAATAGPPRLVVESHAMIGWKTRFTIQKEVVVEEYAIISYDCHIADTAGHPTQADLRASGQRVNPKDILPIRIGKYAWIGNNTHILKGVTIGEGAVVGPNSVVITDLPPYSLSMGNPAEVIMRSYGKPSRRTPPPGISPVPEDSMKPSTAS